MSRGQDVDILTTCVGRAWDVPAACFTCPGEDVPVAIIGLEITDLGGHLPAPMIGLFLVVEGDGRKAFLTAALARAFAAELISMATLLEAGATSAEVQ